MCDAPGVDTLVVAFIVIMAILLGIALALAIVRGRELARIRESLAGSHEPGGPSVAPGSIDPEQTIRSLLDRSSTAEWQTGQVRADPASR